MLEESEGSVPRVRRPDVRRVNDPLSERAPAPHLLAGEVLVYRARYEAIAHALTLPVAQPRPLSSSLCQIRKIAVQPVATSERSAAYLGTGCTSISGNWY